jgi:hypothetical protein
MPPQHASLPTYMSYKMLRGATAAVKVMHTQSQQ